MTTSNTVSRILDTANQAYSQGEGRINENLSSGERRDTLADFLAIELREVTTGEPSPTAAVTSACSAVNTAIRELIAVRDALDNLAICDAS